MQGIAYERRVALRSPASWSRRRHIIGQSPKLATVRLGCAPSHNIATPCPLFPNAIGMFSSSERKHDRGCFGLLVGRRQAHQQIDALTARLIPSDEVEPGQRKQHDVEILAS